MTPFVFLPLNLMPTIPGSCAPTYDAPREFRWLSVLARALSLTILILIGKWVDQYLGGVASGPVPDGKGGNDTTSLFNWHIIIMTLAFGVFMPEALLAYQSPLVPWLNRWA